MVILTSMSGTRECMAEPLEEKWDDERMQAVLSDEKHLKKEFVIV